MQNNTATFTLWDDSPVDITSEANFIWSIANKLRGSYMPDKYGDVVIPMTIIRRFECALEKTKDKVVETFKKNPAYPAKAMQRISGYQFYNTSQFDLKELCNDSEHIAANKVDENTGATIKAKIEKYEQETGRTVTKFGYGYDFEPQQFSIGIKPMQSLTERKFACKWSAEFSMDYYCGRNFEIVDFKYPKAQDYHTNNSNKNFKAFSEDQIYFEGDTVYMIVY